MAFRDYITFGPATLVAAAFIGPGTVVTASLAGAEFGYDLLWALLFAVAATMVLQEMAARIGVVTGQGLGESLRSLVVHPLGRPAFITVVLAAVVVGNSAFQGGNLTGAALGADALAADIPLLHHVQETTQVNLWAILVGLIAIAVLWSGHYKRIERVLVVLVLLMSLAFLTTFVVSRPDLSSLMAGLVRPSIPAGGALTMMALIGTTVVPYALFLHASSASKRWPRVAGESPGPAVGAARRDVLVSIPLGGLVTLAIVSTAASAFFGQTASIEGAADLAQSLNPVFGSAATYLMALGLLAAGVSSSVTAPLASAYALSGVLGWSADMRSWRFRLTWLTIIVIGMLLASLGVRPVTLILFAQVANGILLPLITAFLLLAVNRSELGQYANSRWQNLLGGLVFVVACGLGGRSIWLALWAG
ncbi:Nramp family divalent metal transporter [Aliidiomarina soli]|uniref:Manganese transporter n=1 Tax=Aliidiomarina soli TaxID=1928574 RepID=A0A432WCQ6_9GAMM|nr:Nramp family divalent metal transporter [Aliidiomarina soli]RUO29612.1 manganese transporter [Aliidiomarina soli]